MPDQTHNLQLLRGDMTSQIENRPFRGIRTEITTSTPFDEVISRFRAQMGKVGVAEVVALAKTDISAEDYSRQVEERFVGASGFIIFAEIDHGGWIPKFGINRRSVRWIFGNPLIALTMLRHDITAGLFAPVEMLITEQADGNGTNVIFVRPSTLMVIEEHPPLLAAAQALDEKIDALIAHVLTA
jgi:uncharacterized protein (DUF302 family)